MYAKQTIQIDCNVKHALELHEEGDGCPSIQLILPSKKNGTDSTPSQEQCLGLGRGSSTRLN